MKVKQIVKVAVDLIMMILLPLLMLYSLIGDFAHEWMGIGITVLSILHHVLNCNFIKTLQKENIRLYGYSISSSLYC